MTKVRHGLQWLLLTALLAALLIVIARHGGGTLGTLSSRELSTLVYKIVLLVITGGTALTLLRGERFARALIATFIWAVFALLLLVGYSYRFDLQEVAARVAVEVLPGRAITRGRTVEVARALSGDFDINARINGSAIAMVLDTGASSVVLNHDDAKAAGLPLEMLDYTVRIDTANGRTRAAPVTLDRIAVGGLVEHSVEALIAEPGQLRMSLLGMSFLNRLHSWEVRGDRLVLRGYP